MPDLTINVLKSATYCGIVVNGVYKPFVHASVVAGDELRISYEFSDFDESLGSFYLVEEGKPMPAEAIIDQFARKISDAQTR